MNILRRLTGLAPAACCALALLTGCCVLAVTGGPRLAQASATQALRQALAAVPPASQAIGVSGSWASVTDSIQSATGFRSGANLTPAELGDAAVQLRRDLGNGPLPLAPPKADWLGFNPGLYSLVTNVPRLGGIPASLEVLYRDPLARHLRLVAGSLPGTAPPPATDGAQEVYDIQVAVTPATASRFALRPGSRMVISAPLNQAMPGKLTVVRLDVTGIAAPVDPGSSFWTADPILPAPVLSRVGSTSWEAAVIADPGESGPLQQVFGSAGLLMQWELPVVTAGARGPAQAASGWLNQVVNQAPRLTGPLAPAAGALSVSSGLAQPLAAVNQAASEVGVLLGIVGAGLILAGLVTLLLAARLTAARRSAELTTRRARGASLWQLFLLGTGGAAVACVPATAGAWAAAVLLVPRDAPPGLAAWWPGLAALALATAGPGAAAAWSQRPRRARTALSRWPWVPRVIFEVTACAAAVGGITVFRLQDGGTGRYASLAPVLCAVPVVIVTLRVYQALLRALARAATRRRGVIGFVGLARAAQAPVTNALPAMTLVLALIVAAFAGMVRVAALSTENAAAWRATGADVVVTAPGQLGLSPAAQRAIGAVPGVRHAAAAFTAPLTVGGGSRVVTAVVVDPASYAALTAVAPGYPPLRPGLLTTPPAAGVIPVLASSQAAAALSRTAASAIVAQQGLPSLRVRVAGELPATPALPGGTAFIVMSRSALGGSRAPLPNLLLLTGTAIDMPRLEGVVRALMPGAGAPAITTRQGALRELTGAPLQRGTFLLFAAASAFAVALALVAALLGLALGAAEREMTAARLATMGLTGGQRARLAALEVLPAIAATAAAGAACAFVLPRLLAPAVDLTGLTHAPGPAALRPDVTALALPLAALLVVTVITLACEANFGRRTSRAVR